MFRWKRCNQNKSAHCQISLRAPVGITLQSVEKAADFSYRCPKKRFSIPYQFQIWPMFRDTHKPTLLLWGRENECTNYWEQSSSRLTLQRSTNSQKPHSNSLGLTCSGSDLWIWRSAYNLKLSNSITVQQYHIPQEVSVFQIFFVQNRNLYDFDKLMEQTRLTPLELKVMRVP